MLDNPLKFNIKLEAVPQHHTDGHHPLETAVDSVDHQAASAVADGLEAAALAVGLAAASILAAVPQEAKDGQTTLAAAALVADQAAAASDQVVQEVQADQYFQEFLEAQVGQTVLEDKVAVHLPLPRLTARAPRESRREHHATQP